MTITSHAAQMSIEQGPQVFSAVFAALYAGHVVGDHWVQTDHQAQAKAAPGWPGRLADARHVATLTATQLVAVLTLVAVLGLRLSWSHLALGLVVNAVSHWWADRRTTLAALAEVVPGKGAFYRLGQPRRDHLLTGTLTGTVSPQLTGRQLVEHQLVEVQIAADDNPCLGTGAYALDQSWHIGWLFVAALLVAGGAA